MNEDILGWLQGKLREAGHARFEAIARAAGVSPWRPRHVCYYKPGPDVNANGPGVLAIQPLVTFFEKVERGELTLPDPEPRRLQAPTEA